MHGINFTAVSIVLFEVAAGCPCDDKLFCRGERALPLLCMVDPPGFFTGRFPLDVDLTHIAMAAGLLQEAHLCVCRCDVTCRFLTITFSMGFHNDAVHVMVWWASRRAPLASACHSAMVDVCVQD